MPSFIVPVLLEDRDIFHQIISTFPNSAVAVGAHGKGLSNHGLWRRL